MYTPTDELILHAQRAFDLCRTQVYNFEDCRQLNTQGITKPELCKKETYDLMSCYNKVEETEPICMDPLNNYRECYFQYGGNLLMCEREMHEFNRCQENPKWYAEKIYPKKGGIYTKYVPRAGIPRV